jgi:predicted DNA binding CopG/RHH family protein
MKKQSRRAVPNFASEAEEAAWWYQNRKSHDAEFAAAVENGEAQVLTADKLRERTEASKAKTPAQVISLRVAETDLAMARRQAEQKGLPYQTYIKSLLHETLAAREQKANGHG